ncbi:MAG: hypothetical protein Ct9H300mP11_23610 [Chloroflexota bacterium]|nr:MAG: hypothetical protein Ct9H300mP11_23610 [Chloroflexota bacterium]
MGLGPVPATNKAMKYAGLTMDQIDRVEFNEAFAAQIIPSARELGIPMEKLNVNGGALAIGHPLGPTGGRLVLSLAHELRRSNSKYGLAPTVHWRRNGYHHGVRSPLIKNPGQSYSV